MIALSDPTSARRSALRWPTTRAWRLGSGLVLFGYVLTHLVNHALGNISVAAMDRGLDWAAAIWLGPVGLVALYGALLVHASLGVAALYGRRSLRMGAGDALQLLLGLAIPILMVRHIVATRLAATMYGIGKGYAQVLYGFAVGPPEFGAGQALLLLVAWVHGCIGLYYWLRLKPSFPPIRDVLLGAAVLIPVLALLGFAQGSRAVALLAQDPAWRAANLGPAQTDTAAQAAMLGAVNRFVLAGYAAAIAFVLLARLARGRRRRGLICLSYADGQSVHVPRGSSVLDASRLAGIPHTSVCGGRGRCSTCRVRVLGRGASQLPAPSAAEQAVLDRIGARPGVRLACQLRPTADLAVVPLLAPEAVIGPARRLGPKSAGEERFVVAVFVDMRGSTRLASARLPFDTVFIISRFLTTVARAITQEGGTPNQFLGDGLLALFGLEDDPATAAGAALRAVEAIRRAVASLNDVMAAELDRPIGFGIGLHAGTAIVGEIGDGQHTTFTAIGDPVNIASRLQDLTKTFGCTAVVSDAVYRAAGAPPEGEGRAVTVRGSDEEIPVRLLHAL